MKTQTKTQTKTKTRTRTKILKVFAIFALLLSSNQLIAQTLPSSNPSQTVCANSTEPYEIPSTAQNASSLFTWTLSGGGIPGQPIGPSGAETYVFDRYGMGSGSASAMTSLKFVSEWSRVIEAGTTFTMFGIKSN